ncbi:MAG: DUF1016 family protein [Bacilli bacterium]|nr:DUF1016 family protein [Bacilli bacterium]
MNYYEQVKGLLISNEIHKRVKDYSKNKSDLDTYYNVGRIIVEAQGGEARAKYGDGLIKQYSENLTSELGKGYTVTRLKYYRKFYEVFSKSPTMSDQLSFSHYCELMWLESEKMNYYINISIRKRLSVRQLRIAIKNKEYERLSIETKEKLIENNSLEIGDEIKNPIIINNKKSIEIYDIKEKVLKELIIDDLDSFLRQLGNGFTYVSNEFKLKVKDTFNYIDILLYNYIFKCFVVVELKVTELKKEHIGQVQFYMNYIDNNIKQVGDNKTIGLIIVKENNKYVIKYSTDKRIKSVEYKII